MLGEVELLTAEGGSFFKRHCDRYGCSEIVVVVIVTLVNIRIGSKGRKNDNS